ncbi:MAG: kelch repeat-containing protein [Terracidiphilus sp.]
MIGLRLILFLMAAMGASSIARAQAGDWTWMGGDNTMTNCSGPDASGMICGTPGVYGTEGKPASANVPGGRDRGAMWVDGQGNFWLFGGYGVDSAGTRGQLNDVWEFVLSSKEWVWMGGSNTIPLTCPKNTVGHFCGNSGVYGTQGVFAAGNIPGSRDSGVSWTDIKGNFWLFGGDGGDSTGTYSWLNDLWEFDPSKNEWAWMGGANSNANDCNLWGYTGEIVCGQSGDFGAKGKPGGTPGGRYDAFGWTDRQGNLWLFGGEELDSAGDITLLDDLWELNPSTAQWTWQAGLSVEASNSQVPSVYGIPGEPAAGLTPGGRYAAATWTDNSGNLWLFGGVPDETDEFFISDRWKFNPTSAEWAWMGGSQTEGYGLLGSEAVYGNEGLPGLENTPGGRIFGVSWTDAQGDFWLSGGVGQDATPTGSGGLNDIWAINPSADEWVWMGGGDTAYTPQNNPPGEYGTIGVPALGNMPGTRKGAVYATDSAGNLWLFGGVGVDSALNFGYLNDLWEFNTPPVPVATPAFELYPGPYADSATTYQSGNVSYTIAILNGGGFDSPVALTATGQPAGSTATFSQSSIVGTETSQLNIAVGPDTYTGGYDITVTGTSGSMTQTTQVGLAVIAPYSVNLAGNTLGAQVGGQATMGITLTTFGGFNSPVALAASGQPDGVTFSFSPNSITSSESSVMTVNVAASVAPGIYPITVAGTANGVTQTTGFSLNATAGPPPTFTISASPASITVPAGASTETATLTFTPQNGFAGLVNLACSCSGIYYGLTPDVTLSGSSATAVFTVTGLSQSAEMRPGGRPILAGAPFALVLCLVGWRKRRGLRHVLLLAIAVGALGAVTSCGGGNTAASTTPPPPPPPQTDTVTVTVTATSGAIQQSMPITVTFDLTQ